MSTQTLKNEDGELLSVTEGLRTVARHAIKLLDDLWAEATGNLQPDLAAKYDTMRKEARAALAIAEEPLDWSKCPCCGADMGTMDSYDSVSIEEGDALQKVTCMECDASWGEWYRADERVIYDHGTKQKA